MGALFRKTGDLRDETLPFPWLGDVESGITLSFKGAD